GIRGKHCAAGITNVLLPLVDLIKISRRMAIRRKYVDLKDQATSTRVIVHHVLQRRVGEKPAIPIPLAIDLDGREARGQRSAGHDVFGPDCDLLAVEIGKVAGAHVDRADAQSHLFALLMRSKSISRSSVVLSAEVL